VRCSEFENRLNIRNKINKESNMKRQKVDSSKTGRKLWKLIYPAIMLLILLSLTLTMAVPAAAADSSTKDGGTFANVTNGTGYDWINPTGAQTADDSSWATTTITNSNSTSDYLQATNFGYNIPTEATITGIKVDIERHDSTGGSTTSSIRDSRVRLVKAGVVQPAQDKALTSTDWPNSDAIQSYGGDGDLWTNTWAASEINNSGFGVALSVTRTSGGDNIASVDHIRMTVYYVVLNSSGPYSVVSSSTIVDAGGSYIWQNPGYAQTSDDLRASVSVPHRAGSHNPYTYYQSNYLKATGFGFAIPDFATISGIKVEVEKYADSTNIIDYDAMLVLNNSIISGSDQSTGAAWSTTNPESGYTTYGGQTNMWNQTTATLTPSVINNSNFGFALKVQNRDTSNDLTASVDHIRITVSYSLPTPTITGLDPTSGTKAGGTTVTITGSNFVSGATTVTIGGNSATGVSVTNATTLTAVTPANANTGAVDVVVATSAGSATLAGGYTYTVAPSITDQPGDLSITYGSNATFISVASGTPSPTVHWEVSTNGGGIYSNVVDDAIYDGITTTTLSLNNPPVTYSSNKYRAVFTNGVNPDATSDAAKLTINKATPTATLAVSNSPQTYTGSAQAATVGISASSVPGAVANILTGGATTQTNANTYAVTADFVPTDSTNYRSLTGLSAGDFVIGKATPTATLAVSNSPQTYTGSAQAATVGISASSVPGAVANILTGGAATQTNANTYAVTADFVPTDSTNYSTLTGLSAGNFVIGKATPVITWEDPTAIVFPLALSATQLNAVADVDGSFVYDPQAGTVLDAGPNQTLHVDFTPNDAANYNTASKDVNITIIGGPYQIVFITDPRTLTTSSVSDNMTIETQDIFGTPSDLPFNTTISLYTTSGKGRFAATIEGPFDGTFTSIVIPAGSHSAKFYYKDANPGTPTLTAAWVQLISGTQKETVNGVTPVAKSLVILDPAQTLTVGTTSLPMTVEIRDELNKPFVVGSDTVVNLYSTSGKGRFGISSNMTFNGTLTSVVIPSGQSSVEFFYKDGNTGSPIITASRVGLASGTQKETVNAATKASRIELSTASPNPLKMGVVSGEITVTIIGTDGNPFRVATDTMINLYSTSNKGTFAKTSAGPFNGTFTSVTILANSSSATFYYKDNKVSSSTTVTAAKVGLTSGTQVWTIIP
jgi:hypothetical protein